MKKNKLFILGVTLNAVIFTTTACIGDLDTAPLNPNTQVSSNVFKSVEDYKEVLAKLYAGLATSGQRGPAGNGDIKDIDEGFSQYLRQYFQLQQLPTDEAVIQWNDAGLSDLHNMKWASNNQFIQALYYRILFQVSLANEFIREASASKLSSRGISGADKSTVEMFKAEARLLRAISYWHALDLYGSVPFVTDADPVGSFEPRQASPAELFAYIESEAKELENILTDARQNEYARLDKAGAWMLLAKLYLNASVYTGNDRSADCITYCDKIIKAGYTLSPTYAHLFLADNNSSNAKNEIIFPIAFDGAKTQTWGGMTYIIHAAIGGAMNKDSFGISAGGWGGLRTTPQFVDKFPDETGTKDKRAMFFTNGQTKDIADVGQFTNGYAITKFKNITSTGETPTSDPTGNHVDTDFPMFRLADAYLMYAEAVVRAGGDKTTAVSYINQLRQRAYGDNSGDITESQLTLDFILDERARELYWEGHRRTDLIRHGKYTGGTYLWAWKGGKAEGESVADYLRLYPLPASDLNANTKLKQNTGY